MFSIIEFEELPSTNDYLKQHTQSIADKSVILTKRQSAGRGRFDRVWESDQDLMFSILFHQEAKHELLAPLCVVSALSQFSINASIKWPNDIIVEHKKVAGILVEKLYDGIHEPKSIVGIGINLSKKRKDLEKAGYLQVEKKALLEKILIAYDRFLQLSEEKVLHAYQKVSYLYGKKVCLDGIIWTVAEIEEHGYLKVYHQDTIRYLNSEEVSLSAVYEEDK